MTQGNYRLADIHPNPFRDIANYPIIEGKIETLRASYRNTSVWPTIVARLRPDGHPEIAFGHHRVEAARREFGKKASIPLNIEPLDDAAMLKMMANENMTEYTAAAAVTQETVRQVVLAFGAGRIELGTVTARRDPAELRYAPHFVRGDGAAGATPSKSYNATTVAAFLGWGETKVKEALAALEETERGTFKPADFRGMTTKQARAAVTSVRSAERAAKSHGLDPKPVKEAARRAAVAAVKADKGHDAVREEADAAYRRHLPPPTHKAIVPADVAKAIYNDIDNFWRIGIRLNGQGTLNRAEVVRLIAQNRDARELRGVAGPWSEQIADALLEMAKVARSLADALRSETAVTA